MTDELTRIALVGTAKSGATAVASDHPADQALDQIGDLSIEDRVLLQAGARSLYRQAGLRLQTGVNSIAPAPPETRPVLGGRSAQLLAQAWDLGSKPVLYVLFHEMQRANRLMPPELIPRALSEVDSVMRKASAPLLGERGAWLKQLHPKWNEDGDFSPQALEVVLSNWDDSSQRDRSRAMRTLRSIDPERGREIVTASLPAASASDRAGLVAALRQGLSPADEPLLEKCLDDPAESVRREAVHTLSSLPMSAYRRRMLKRAETLLAIERKGLVKKKLTAIVTPPKERTAEDIRDGMPEKSADSKGQRATWLKWIVSQVPPDFWLKKLDASPEELIAAFTRSEYGEDLLTAWLANRLPEAPPSWIEAILNCWLHSELSLGTFDQRNLFDLMDRIPRPAAESIVERLLLDPAASVQRYCLSEMSLMHRPPWSAQFSRAFLKGLAGSQEWFTPRSAPMLMAILKAAQGGIAIEALPELTAFVAQKTGADSVSNNARTAFLELEERVKLRHEFHISLISDS